MTTPQDDPQARLRRHVYLLLIVLGTGAMLGRIAAVDAVDRSAIQEQEINSRVNAHLHAVRPSLEKKLQAEGLGGRQSEEKLKETLEEERAREEARLRSLIYLRRPFQSANDRSRWCMVRALVEPEMRVEGHPYAIDKVVAEPNWDTIDMVKHDDQGRGGMGPNEGHLYSSKPPLLPTLVAGEYWVIYRLNDVLAKVGLSLTTDGRPLSLATHAHVVGRFMLVTINLIPLVIGFLLLARLIERFGTTDWGRIFTMGAAVFGTFLTTFVVTFNNHLPAAVCGVIALYAAVRIWFDGERRLRYFIIAGFFGAMMAANELPALALFAVLSLILLLRAPGRTVLAYLPAAVVVAAGFFGTNWIAHKSLVPPYMHRSDTDKSDNWYDYTYVRGEGKDAREISSYWNDPVGVDRGEPCTRTYALHALVGHHGVFSLTPIWLLSFAGVIVWLCPGRDPRLRCLALTVAAVTVACFAFYLFLSDQRNYGGVCSGFRWMFWLAPVWLVTMLPAVDGMARRGWTRCVAAVLLLASIFSASYPTWTPWTNPWLWDWLRYLNVPV
ncbi:MAG TPA: hypothetical protein VMY42_22200 [Thermoguttaceae bacterium]|nr:hypothetical protein [Thermoguttaceae bacterium]